MKIFCNSWPKAGTHVLLEVARAILGDGDWYHESDLKIAKGAGELRFKISQKLSLYGDSFALKGHLPRTEEIEAILDAEGFKVLFIVRDPREVICSTLRWLLGMRGNWEVSRHLACFPAHDRVTMGIRGFLPLSPFDQDLGVDWTKPLPERYEALTRWCESDKALFCRYEDLTGENGRELQDDSLSRILTFLEVDPTISPATLSERVVNKDSATFFKGTKSRWPSVFDRAQRDLFKKLGGELLVERFGYRPTDEFEEVGSGEMKVAPPKPASVRHRGFRGLKMKAKSSLKRAERFFGSPLRRIEVLSDRVKALEHNLEMVAGDRRSAWLYANRVERMDGLSPLFPFERRSFHLARYDFASFFCRNADVADAACGTGYGSFLLKELGGASSVKGVDLDAEAIEYASALYGQEQVQFVAASAEALPFTNESFDVLVSFETIEHVPNDKRVVEEFARVLRPGGHLIVSTPNRWPIVDHPHHVREYSRQSFGALLQRHFEVEKLLNQNSGGGRFNRHQSAGLIATTEHNAELAECFLAVCRKKA